MSESIKMIICAECNYPVLDHTKNGLFECLCELGKKELSFNKVKKWFNDYDKYYAEFGDLPDGSFEELEKIMEEEK